MGRARHGFPHFFARKVPWPARKRGQFLPTALKAGGFQARGILFAPATPPRILDFPANPQEPPPMPVQFEVIAREALELTPRQRLKLAEVLLVSADGEPEVGYQASWDEEIEARILAIDEGREEGVSLEEVLAAADKLLAQ